MATFNLETITDVEARGFAAAGALAAHGQHGARKPGAGVPMLRMSLAALGLVAGLSMAGSAAALTFPIYTPTYRLDIAGAGAHVGGTITLQGDLLDASDIDEVYQNIDIIDFNIKITVGTHSFDFLGPLSGGNSDYYVFDVNGFTFTNSADGLFYNFSAGPGAALVYFQTTSSGTPTNQFCMSNGDNCFSPLTSGISLLVDGHEATIPLTGVVRIGTLVAVPEPATWAMMLLGFAGLGGALRRRRRAPAAA